MASSMSSTREMAIASRKRPSSPTPSESDPLSECADSHSDFEHPNNPSKKPVKKKARTTKAPVALPKAEVLPKISKEYQSDEGNLLFSAKWYKEVTKRDAFWTDFKKKVPKAVWQKRFKVELAIDLNEESGKASRGGEKTTLNVGKVRQSTAARKMTRQPADATPTADPMTNGGTPGDAQIASTELVAGDGQTHTEDSATLNNDVKLEQEAAEIPQEPVSAGIDTQQDNTDPFSRIPNITPEKRAEFIAASQDQARTARIIEMQLEEKNRLGEEREKRAAAKERKAAKAADLQSGNAEEALESGEGGKTEQSRKIFAPTTF